MTQSAPEPSLVFLFGQAVVRAVYITTDQIVQTSTIKTPEDLPYGVTYVTGELEKKLGKKLAPGRVFVCGTQKDLEALQGVIEAEFVTEAQAIGSAEKYLSTKLGSHTAILDLGPSAYRDHFPAEDVARWLPYVVNLNDIENYLANKRLSPRVLPTTEHEYELDLAVARQSIIKLGEKEGLDYFPVPAKINLVLTGGLLTGIPKVSDLVSVVLDSFFFARGAKILVDRDNVLIALGAAMTGHHEEVEFPLNPVNLSSIGSVLHLKDGHMVVVDFGLQEKQRLALEEGEVVRLPVKDDAAARISVPELNDAIELSGGEGGIYLDNRMRPLGVAAGSKDSIGRIQTWRQSLQGRELTGEAVA